MARRNRRLTTACAGSVAAGLLASGGVLVDRAAGATPPGTAAPTAPRGVSAVPMGAYLDYGPAGVTRMQQLSQWLGGAELTVGHTYLPGDRWSNIEGSGLGFLEDWARWRRGADGRLFVLNVPMLDRNEERVPDWLVRWKLRAGAAGRFDHHFRALGQRLVSLGVPDTVVVLGWEMNGTTYAHRCGPDPRSWRAYWRRAVAALRSVPGQRFRFDFAPNRGRDAVPWTLCYPGDDVVDIVGMDSYDQAPGRTFEEQASAPYGLHDQVAFARAHNKQISYPEWGLFRNGDNPDYMRGMLEWIERHRPLYQTITDYCPHGVWQCDDNPKSSKVFHEMLAKPVTVPPVSPAPPVTPVPPVVPSPVTPGGSVAPGASGTATAPGVSGTAPVADPVAHPLWGPAGTAPVADPTPRRTPTASSVPPPAPTRTTAPAPVPTRTPAPTRSPSAASPAAPGRPQRPVADPTAPAAPAAPTRTAAPAPAPVRTTTAAPAPVRPSPAPVPSAPLLVPPSPSVSGPPAVAPSAPSSVPPSTPTPQPTRTTPPVTAPKPTPVPVAQAPVKAAPGPVPDAGAAGGPLRRVNSRQWCVPVDFGERVARWLGTRRICVEVPSWPLGRSFAWWL